MLLHDRMRRLALASLVPVLLTAACHSSDTLSPTSAAGTYALSTVNGLPLPITGTAAATTGVILSGSLVLGADGSAVHQITYGVPGAPTGQAVVTRGTFTVRADSVVLAMIADAGTPTTTMRWAAARQGTALALRFAAPQDGPDIVEVYARQ